MNEDKIKVLEKALTILELELSLYFGICDAIMHAVNIFDYPDTFREPKFYGIKLPKAEYLCSDGLGDPAFSYPCTLGGRQQRIEVLKEAIKNLKSKAMNQQEKDAVIDKIIRSQFRGMRMTDIYYNDRYNALVKLSDEELLKQNSELN